MVAVPSNTTDLSIFDSAKIVWYMKAACRSATGAVQRLLMLNKQYEYEVNGKDQYKCSICVVKLDNVTINE